MKKTKQCRKCKKARSVKLFSKDRSAKDGLQAKCNLCLREYYREHREEQAVKQKIRYDAKLVTEGKTRRRREGQGKWPEYKAYVHMMDRCYRKTDGKYKDYGGRGIEVCQRWRNDFFNFYEDMGPRPGAGYSLERKDVEGDYCLENCKWATQKEQQNNRRNNRRLEFQGRTLTMKQWSEETGIPWDVIKGRLDVMKWSVEDALTRPVKKLGPRGGQLVRCAECGEDFKTSWTRPKECCSRQCARVLYHKRRKGEAKCRSSSSTGA